MSSEMNSHLLLQATADDEVVLVQAQCQCLAVIYFLPHPLPDQTLPFLARGRPLPDEDETVHHGPKLALRDHDLRGRGFAVAIEQAVADEEQRAEHEEVNQRLADKPLSHHFAGEYQMGEV